MKDMRITAYEIWAQYGALWTQWTKPALFSVKPRNLNDIFTPNELKWPLSFKKNTLIIVDLEGPESIKEGMGFAKIGYRPVPLYNCVMSYDNYCTVDVKDLHRTLFSATRFLQDLKFIEDAPPVFLLDSRRMYSSKKRGFFDNRWQVFPQDMPSAKFLKQHGIEKIIIRTEAIQADIAHILYRYQKEGIEIYTLYKRSENMEKVNIRKPKKFKCLSYRFFVILGLRRNPAGGFGSLYPDITATHYG